MEQLSETSDLANEEPTGGETTEDLLRNLVTLMVLWRRLRTLIRCYLEMADDRNLLLPGTAWSQLLEGLREIP